MESVNLADVLSLLGTARALAESSLKRAPTALPYRVVLEQRDVIEAALPRGAANAFEAARPLGVVAVREFDGESDEMGRQIFEISDKLRRLAGLPDHA